MTYFERLKHCMAFVDVSTLQVKEQIKGFHGRAIHTGTQSFLYWSVEAGASIPMHSHHHEQVAHVLTGRFELTLDSETRVLEPGIVAVIPPHVPHGGKAITDCQLLDVFMPERDDYKW
jgi:quercetin dioxygenase-like cupin family protein